jgi:hypothetical protein
MKRIEMKRPVVKACTYCPDGSGYMHDTSFCPKCDGIGSVISLNGKTAPNTVEGERLLTEIEEEEERSLIEMREEL